MMKNSESGYTDTLFSPNDTVTIAFEGYDPAGDTSGTTFGYFILH